MENERVKPAEAKQAAKADQAGLRTKKEWERKQVHRKISFEEKIKTGGKKASPLEAELRRKNKTKPEEGEQEGGRFVNRPYGVPKRESIERTDCREMYRNLVNYGKNKLATCSTDKLKNKGANI